MIKILSNEPSTIYYKDVKIGETFIYPKYKDTIYIKIKEICYTEHDFRGKNETYEASCVNITSGVLEDFCEDDKVLLIDCTIKWEYDSKDKKNK